jgi:biopolymer transport protein ExbD
MRLEKKRASGEIFTGSMADIVFLLIIYFMLTMAFSSTKGLDFAVPKEDTARSQIEAEASVLVQVNANGTYTVDGKSMLLSQLPDYLKTKIDPGSNPPVISKPVILHPVPDAPYWAMMAAFDQLRQVKDELHLAKDLNISLPTQREIESVWGALGVISQ